MSDAISFTAVVAQVRTMADGGIRITLDLPETAIETATKMMQVRQAGAVLEIAAVAVKSKILINNKEQHAIQKGSKRKSEWTTAQEQSANRPA